MTDHERYLIERLTVEVAKLRETIEELVGNGRGPLAPHGCVSRHALAQLRQIASRLKERADEAQGGAGNDAELAPRAQDKRERGCAARRDAAPYRANETRRVCADGEGVGNRA